MTGLKSLKKSKSTHQTIFNKEEHTPPAPLDRGEKSKEHTPQLLLIEGRRAREH